MKISNSKKELARIISENGGWIGATELSAQDSDGWIEWKGEPKSPVANGVMVDVRLKGGAYHEAELLDDASWSDTWGNESIIAYRLHKPERAKPEFCESVMRSIPEPDEQVWTNPPTIEQLAADYRNAKDYAERKQQEADDAKADADARLAAFVSAVKAVGLIPVDIVKPALDACMQLVDMVPTRLQSHQDESVAAIGYVVNVERLYDKVRDAVDSLK